MVADGGQDPLAPAVPVEDLLAALGLILLGVEQGASALGEMGVAIHAGDEHPLGAHHDGHGAQQNPDGAAVRADDAVDDAEVRGEPIGVAEAFDFASGVLAHHVVVEVLADQELRVSVCLGGVRHEALLVDEGVVVGDEMPAQVVGPQEDGVAAADELLDLVLVLDQAGAAGEHQEIPALVPAGVGRRLLRSGFLGPGVPGRLRRGEGAEQAAPHDLGEQLAVVADGGGEPDTLERLPDVLDGVLVELHEVLRVVGVALEDAGEHIGQLMPPAELAVQSDEVSVDAVEDRDHVVLVLAGLLQVGQKGLERQVAGAAAHAELGRVQIMDTHP